MSHDDAKAYLVGEWEVIPALRRLCRKGEVVTPRAKVFELLLYLLDRRDRLVTREELVSQIWKDTAVSGNSLAQCMIELRKLLGDDAHNPRFIRTVPKVGYQLIGPVEEVLPSASAPPAAEAPAPQPRRRDRRTAAVAAGAIAACVLAGGLAFGGRVGNHAPAPKAVGGRRESGMIRQVANALWEAAWWKLDEMRDGPVHDSSGNGLNGLIRAGGKSAPGRLGGGLWLDGVQGVVTGTGAGVLPSGSAPRTISLWMKPVLPHVEDTALFTYGSELRETTEERYSLDLGADGRLGFGMPVDRGFLISSRRWDDGDWHLVTATYEGLPSNRAQIFVDGKLDKSEELGGVPATNGRAGWRIGQYLPGVPGFRGVLDDVRVYRRALNEAQVSALYRCSAGIHDLGGYYYLPVFYPGLVIEKPAAEDSSSSFRNDGKDYTGIQLARSDGNCGLASLSGADAGQDLRISVDLLAPRDAAGRITEAGPYFRSRSAMAGEGLIGGTSAGYWVQLISTGAIKVRRLNPRAVVAFSTPISGFDSAVFHNLQTEARAETLRVWLDGRPIAFEQGDQRVERVLIPPVWEGPPRTGDNEGAAGVAFGAEDNRLQIGGQRARNLRVTALPE